MILFINNSNLLSCTDKVFICPAFETFYFHISSIFISSSNCHLRSHSVAFFSLWLLVYACFFGCFLVSHRSSFCSCSLILLFLPPVSPSTVITLPSHLCLVNSSPVPASCFLSSAFCLFSTVTVVLVKCWCTWFNTIQRHRGSFFASMTILSNFFVITSLAPSEQKTMVKTLQESYWLKREILTILFNLYFCPFEFPENCWRRETGEVTNNVGSVAFVELLRRRHICKCDSFCWKKGEKRTQVKLTDLSFKAVWRAAML